MARAARQNLRAPFEYADKYTDEFMKITFESYMDIFRMRQLCLFAQHSQNAVNSMRELDEDRAWQMLQENEQWKRMDDILRNAKPNSEITI